MEETDKINESQSLLVSKNKRFTSSTNEIYDEESLIEKINQINSPETICKYMNDIVAKKCTREICSKYFMPVKYSTLARVVLMYVKEINYDWNRQKYVLVNNDPMPKESITTGRPPIEKLKKCEGINVNFMIDKNVYETFCKCWEDSTGTKGEHFTLAVKEYCSKYYNQNRKY